MLEATTARMILQFLVNLLLRIDVPVDAHTSQALATVPRSRTTDEIGTVNTSLSSVLKIALSVDTCCPRYLPSNVPVHAIPGAQSDQRLP